MATIKLDRAEIEEKIKNGDNCEGHYALAVAPDGSDWKNIWSANNRQWDPYPDGWLEIGIPALDPEGSGQGSEDAEDCLKAVLSPEAFQIAKERQQSGEIGWPALAEELDPEGWAYNRAESAAWMAGVFLAACNGDGDELNDPNPWGYRNDYDEIDPISPPAEFEWA